MQPPLPWRNILQELRSQDFDRYACCLFAPLDHRADLAALFLFNATLAQIRDQVTEPVLGQIRLQWWRDALAVLSDGGKAPAQPILTSIAAWHERGLDISPLQMLIEARAADLENPPFPTLAKYKGYRENTSRPLGVMAAWLLGQKELTELYAGSMELYATIGLLRAVPHWVRRRQLPLPPEWLQQYKIGETDLMELHASSGLTAAIRAEAMRVLTASGELQQQWRALPKPERQAGLCLWLHLALARQDARHLLQTTEHWQPMVPMRWLRLANLAWRALRGV